MNSAEAQAFRDLRELLPEHFVVLGNFELQLPRRANTFEYDAVVIGEYGAYAVEIKGWRGTVTGDIRRWQLDWGRVENPFIRTEQKAKALRHLLVTSIRELPDEIFCQSVVYFPRDVQIDLDDPRAERAFGRERLFDFFVDRDRIARYGPGPLLDETLRNEILECLTPLASPRSDVLVVPGYEIEGELDRGDSPFREFIGKHKLLHGRRKVRIKAYSMDPLLSPHQREREYRRVLRDMEALHELEDNPYVARPYELIQDREDSLLFFLVSEWVGPLSMAEYIQGLHDSGPWPDPPPDFYRFAQHLLRAVSFMHEEGIVHRNLNPSVLYLTGSPHAVPLKIADFDFARVASLPSIAGDFDQLGTEGYVAPEMWRGEPYDHRIDAFAIGAILFELYTGRPLFESLTEVMSPEKIWEQRRDQIGDREFRGMMNHLLAADPEARMQDFGAAIDYCSTMAKKSSPSG